MNQTIKRSKDFLNKKNKLTKEIFSVKDDIILSALTFDGVMYAELEHVGDFKYNLIISGERHEPLSNNKIKEVHNYISIYIAPIAVIINTMTTMYKSKEV